MCATTHELIFNGGLLERGFWLYVWEVTPPKGAKLYYVGRTGDSSSINAQSPFNRMGQHLGFTENSNMLRRHLRAVHVQPEQCSFRLIAHGPVLKETSTKGAHRKRRDIIAGIEKALAEAMRDSGYNVLNTVKCRKSLDGERFAHVRLAFASEFPMLRRQGKEGKKATEAK